MSTTVDETVSTNGERINSIDYRAASVMLPLHTHYASRRVWRAQSPVIAYAGFVPSCGTSAHSNPDV